jgi:hypothetical protein
VCGVWINGWTDQSYAPRTVAACCAPAVLRGGMAFFIISSLATKKWQNHQSINEINITIKTIVHIYRYINIDNDQRLFGKLHR